MKFDKIYCKATSKFDEAKKDKPKNCSECKFSSKDSTVCNKTKETITPNDWCAAGKKKEEMKEARDPKELVGKYIHRGMTGTSNTESPRKIKDAKKVKGVIEVLIDYGGEETWMEYDPSMDNISKGK